MKISIVTLSYNQGEYLRMALNSVLGQDHEAVEYIVVDPGSSDGSREMILSYGEDISAAIFEPDQGAAEGLNKGFTKATGDILGFLNADDVLLPGSLFYVNRYFEEHPDCSLLFGDGIVIDSRGDKRESVRASFFSPLSYCYGGADWLQQSTFFRREAFDLVGGFNEANKTSWDGELFVRMALKGVKVEYLHKALGCFRIHPASITGSQLNSNAYGLDRRSLFTAVTGRNWARIDGFYSIAFRLRRLIFSPARIIAAFRTRFRKRVKR